MAESKDQDNQSEKSAAPDESVENGDTPEIDAPDESSGYQAPEGETPGEDRSEEMQAVEDFDLNLLLDIPLEITVELGRAKVQIQELLELGPGSTVKLSKLEGEPVDILANNKLIARGEVVLQNKKYGIRITEITSRMNRIKTLS
jgi:flagellar motor switch protein FliN